MLSPDDLELLARKNRLFRVPVRRNPERLDSFSGPSGAIQSGWTARPDGLERSGCLLQTIWSGRFCGGTQKIRIIVSRTPAEKNILRSGTRKSRNPPAAPEPIPLPKGVRENNNRTGTFIQLFFFGTRTPPVRMFRNLE